MAMRTSYATLDGEIVSVSIDGVRKDLIPDPLGSVAALVDSTGTITDTFTYWPYGEERTRTGTTEISTRFVGAWGYYWDNPKRDYVRARYLEKNQTRWLTVDPLWPREMAYRYAQVDPINMVDDSGLSPCSQQRPCYDILGGPVALEAIRKCIESSKGDPEKLRKCIKKYYKGKITDEIWAYLACISVASGHSDLNTHPYSDPCNPPNDQYIDQCCLSKYLVCLWKAYTDPSPGLPKRIVDPVKCMRDKAKCEQDGWLGGDA